MAGVHRPEHGPNVISPLRGRSSVLQRTPGAGSGPHRAADCSTITIVSTRSLAVTGMSCDHCANAVRAEISKLPGITDVDVDIAAGTVRVVGNPLPGDAALREAIEEAGYEFAG